MRKSALVLTLLVVVAALTASSRMVRADPPPSVAIPAENARELRRRPAVPPVGPEDEERARRLFAAIQQGDPEGAIDFYFPRDPFLVLKAIANPGRYWDRLIAMYRRDIRRLHRETPRLAEATFDRLVLSPTRTWMTVGREANHLPYWSVYHSYIQYNVGERRRRLEVRVLINWGPRWYVTHLI